MLEMRILYIQYTNPACYPPLEHSSRILANAGWKVLFLGTEAPGADSLRFPPHKSVTVKRLPFCPAGFRQKIHYLIYCFWVVSWTVVWRPRWLYASDLLSCPIALALALIPGRRVIYHEHDSPPAKSAANGPGRLALWTRRLLAERAECSIVPNESRAQHFQAGREKSHSRVLCVWNCPSRDEISKPRLRGCPKDIWLLYHGSIVPDRLPLSVLAALAKLPESVKLRVIGYETVGNSGYVDVIQAAARTLQISHRVNLLGLVPSRMELLHHCRQSDIGLTLMPMATDDLNMLAMTGASNKPFDYLCCGLALLVSDLPAWRKIYVDPGYAVACNPDDPLSIEQALRSLLDDPVKMREMGERGRRRIESEWNYEMEFAKVYEVLTGPSLVGILENSSCNSPALPRA
jgi:glycosyltransferase involved in cell wall biosynthesis